MLGKLTLRDYFNRTLQSAAPPTVPVWDFAAHPPPDFVWLSVGGNDFNHQHGDVPANATFTAAYEEFLLRVFEAYVRGAGRGCGCLYVAVDVCTSGVYFSCGLACMFSFWFSRTETSPSSPANSPHQTKPTLSTLQLLQQDNDRQRLRTRVAGGSKVRPGQQPMPSVYSRIHGSRGVQGKVWRWCEPLACRIHLCAVRRLSGHRRRRHRLQRPQKQNRAG